MEATQEEVSVRERTPWVLSVYKSLDIWVESRRLRTKGIRIPAIFPCFFPGLSHISHLVIWQREASVCAEGRDVVASASEDASPSVPNCTSGLSPRWRKHGSCRGTELSGCGNLSLAGTELEPLSGTSFTKVLLGQPAFRALVNV